MTTLGALTYPRYENGTGNVILQGAWARWASHRAAVMRSLFQATRLAESARTLCCLGAGNCNDIVLKELTRDYEEVALADIDAQAVAAGVASQGLRPESVIQVAPIDLAGDVVGRHHSLQESYFDVVLSAGLMTQLFESVVRKSRDPTPAQLLEVRSHHLHLIAKLLRPRGVGVLVTELVSSDTAPHLVDISSHGLNGEFWRLVQTGNFFTGTNPLSICHWLSAVEGIALKAVKLTSPWLWPVTADRTFLTYALLLQRDH